MTGMTMKLAVAGLALLVGGGAALVRCGIGNVAVEKAFPAGDHLVEGDPARNNAIIRFSLPADCFASTKPQTICNRLIGTMYNPGDSRLK